MKIFGIVRSAVQLITDRFVDDDLRQPNLTLRGNIAVESLIVGPVGPVPTVAVVDNNAVVPAQTVALGITENYVYNTVAGAWNRALSIPNDADGQVALTQGTPGVIARLQGWNGATFDRVRSQGDNADSVPVSANGHVAVWAHSGLFNGNSFDRQRGTFDLIILPSAVRGATTNSADFTNYNGKTAIFFIDVTAVPGVSTLSLIYQAKDPVSGNYVTIATQAVGAGVTTIALTVAFGTTFVARTFRVQVAHTGAGNFTYSVGCTVGA